MSQWNEQVSSLPRGRAGQPWCCDRRGEKADRRGEKQIWEKNLGFSGDKGAGGKKERGKEEKRNGRVFRYKAAGAAARRPVCILGF